jgi:hypothetical protein
MAKNKEEKADAEDEDETDIIVDDEDTDENDAKDTENKKDEEFRLVRTSLSYGDALGAILYLTAFLVGLIVGITHQTSGVNFIMLNLSIQTVVLLFKIIWLSMAGIYHAYNT